MNKHNKFPDVEDMNDGYLCVSKDNHTADEFLANCEKAVEEMPVYGFADIEDAENIAVSECADAEITGTIYKIDRETLRDLDIVYGGIPNIHRLKFSFQRYGLWANCWIYVKREAT